MSGKPQPHWSERLDRLCPCWDGGRWLRRQPDPKTAWLKCKRSDWLLWILREAGHTREDIVMTLLPDTDPKEAGYVWMGWSLLDSPPPTCDRIRAVFKRPTWKQLEERT